jgi:hypothetical protein
MEKAGLHLMFYYYSACLHLRKTKDERKLQYSRSNIPGDQEGLFKLAVQLRKFFNSVIYNTATGYVLLVYLTNI